MAHQLGHICFDIGSSPKVPSLPIPCSARSYLNAYILNAKQQKCDNGCNRWREPLIPVVEGKWKKRSPSHQKPGDIPQAIGGAAHTLDCATGNVFHRRHYRRNQHVLLEEYEIPDKVCKQEPAWMCGEYMQ